MKKKLIIGLALMSILPFNVYAYSNYIYAGGDNIGIEISSKGVMVVGFYENLEINNKIKVGDYIEKVNGNVVSDIDNLVNFVNKYQTDGKVTLTLRRKNKTFDIREEYSKKIEQTNKTLIEINNNLDKMYMDKLKGILQEEDYIRVSKKINFEKEKLIAQKKELEQKNSQAERKIETKNTTKEEVDNLIENFLKLEKIDKIYLYRLINKIEIDKDKNIYIYFNFSKLNLIAGNLGEFVKVEELIN